MKMMDDLPAGAIRHYLLTTAETISVAESVTAGLLQLCLSSIPDAAKFFQGGITAYNVAQKYKHLAVEPLHALSVNCVSPDVANEMALQTCALFASHWGIGITGYATAVPESGGELYAFYAIAKRSNVLLSGKLCPPTSTPFDVQMFYAQEVLNLLTTKF